MFISECVTSNVRDCMFYIAAADALVSMSDCSRGFHKQAMIKHGLLSL